MQTLRNAPDAQEGRRLRGGVFEIDPHAIETTGRLDDRLGMEIDGLRASIAQNGQRVPILVRPLDDERFGLIYGRRRLEVCRVLGIKVRAIVTEMEGDEALRDQLLENQERRDLSFIERALVAAALLEGDHLSELERTNKGVAEVLNLTEAGVSQLLGVVRVVGEPLIQAIGAAPGIGRPRWEELKRHLARTQTGRDALVELASMSRAAHHGGADEGSDHAFLAVLSAAAGTVPTHAQGSPAGGVGQVIPGVGAATVTTGRRGFQLRLELKAEEREFVSWLQQKAPQLLTELHARWRRAED
ncbi:MAG: ParB/RepB/Spo0J family partition protein [Roseinatronobacter sp.]